jgi:hypothetical protein
LSVGDDGVRTTVDQPGEILMRLQRRRSPQRVGVNDLGNCGGVTMLNNQEGEAIQQRVGIPSCYVPLSSCFAKMV